jgi:hypothetical protein
MKTQTLEEAAEKWLETNGHKWSNNDDTAGDNYGSFIAGAEWQAERMYSEQNISLLEWIRNNAVEVQGGWQYDNLTYTDKEILEVYYKQSKKQDQ